MSTFKTNGILFDLDGTLWDSTSEIADAWNELIKIKGGVDRPPITKEELHGCMGLPMYSIAAKLFPNMPEQDRNDLMDEMGVFENDYLRERGAKLFDGIERVIEETSKNVPIFIVSNCQQGYIELLMEKGGLGGLISDFDCFGNTGLPKGQTLRLLCERCNVRDAVYVGDTQGDMEASEQAGLPFVWAAYGFGKPAHWDKRIDHFTDLLRL